jgi:hypothetical protein
MDKQLFSYFPADPSYGQFLCLHTRSFCVCTPAGCLQTKSDWNIYWFVYPPQPSLEKREGAVRNKIPYILDKIFF